MSVHAAASRSAAIRVFGTIGSLMVALIAVAATVRPDMMMSVIHMMMGT